MKPSIPMRRSSVLVLLLASLSACAVFGGGTQQPAVYSIPNMEQAKIRSDLTYKTVAGADLKMDAYYPANFQNSTRLPAVILVHGDGSPSQLKNAKDWGVFVSYGRVMAASNLIGISFTHRSSENFTKMEDVAKDVDDLVAYVRNNADSLNIDRDRICMWFFSAGGTLLRMPLRDKPSFVRCLVAYYPWMGIPPGKASDEVVKAFTPAGYLNGGYKGIAPMLLVRAGQDSPDTNQLIDNFIRDAQAQNAPLEVINYAEGHHGFDVRDDNDKSREIIKRTVEFVAKHLR
jgi:dienelactone hydrolase